MADIVNGRGDITWNSVTLKYVYYRNIMKITIMNAKARKSIKYLIKIFIINQLQFERLEYLYFYIKNLLTQKLQQRASN